MYVFEKNRGGFSKIQECFFNTWVFFSEILKKHPCFFKPPMGFQKNTGGFFIQKPPMGFQNPEVVFEKPHVG